MDIYDPIISIIFAHCLLGLYMVAFMFVDGWDDEHISKDELIEIIRRKK